MEIVSGSVHTAFPLDDASRIGQARRHAALLAESMAWDEVDAGRLALVVTELATNLLRHAQKGRLLLACNPDAGEVEVLAIDSGPGVANLDQCLADGFSTGGTQGTGLGAVRRMAQDFDIHSVRSQGTVVLARLRPKGRAATAGAHHAVRLRGISTCAPGETECGDGWAACLDGARASAMMADGLGHGPDASKAAQAALDVFRQAPFADLKTGLQEAHRALRTTRGAAVSTVELDPVAGKVRGVGAGNVTVRILSGVSDRSMLSQHGTVGVQIRSVQELAMDWPLHAIVVMQSDGIETRWSPQLLLPVLGRDPTLAAALLLRDHCRGRDDATILVMRRGG